MDLNSLPKFSIRGSIAPNSYKQLEEESVSASDLAKFLDSNKDAPDILLEVSSHGGFVSEGFQMYDLLISSGKNIFAIGYRVNSIAVVPFLAAPFENRLVSKNVEFFIHLARIDPINLGFESLTASDLVKLAEEISQTDAKIISLYENVLGSKNIPAIAELMAQEKDLGSEGAIELGFAKGIYEAAGETKNKKVKIKNFVAEDLILNKINDKKMADEKVNGLMKTVQKILNAIKGIKNQITVKSGEKTIIIEAEEGEDWTGKKAVYADEDGLATATVVEPGDHTLDTGDTITVGEGGVISAVKAAETIEAAKAEAENLRKDLAAMTAERDELKNKYSQLENQVKDLDTNFQALMKEHTNLKAEVPGDPDKLPKNKKPEVKNEAPKRMADKLRAYSMKKFEENKN